VKSLGFDEVLLREQRESKGWGWGRLWFRDVNQYRKDTNE